MKVQTFEIIEVAENGRKNYFHKDGRPLDFDGQNLWQQKTDYKDAIEKAIKELRYGQSTDLKKIALSLDNVLEKYN